MADTTSRQHAIKVVEFLDREAAELRGDDYREFLEEISADIESKLQCLNDEESED